MKSYRVVCLSEAVFNTGSEFVQANSPKQAAEIKTGKKVKRVTSGGNIVVYGCSCNQYEACIKSYVYEVDNEQG